MVNDLTESRVLYVAEGRTEASLNDFWARWNTEQRAVVQAVAMDMWEPYLNSVRAHLSDADRKIVFDKFHIAKHLSEAVDKVRRRRPQDKDSDG